MCRRVQCATCGKATFAGCGMHVEQVLAGVPMSDRCQGHARAKAEETPSEPKKPGSGWWPFSKNTQR